MISPLILTQSHGSFPFTDEETKAWEVQSLSQGQPVMGSALFATKRKAAELMDGSSVHLGWDAIQNNHSIFSKHQGNSLSKRGKHAIKRSRDAPCHWVDHGKSPWLMLHRYWRQFSLYLQSWFHRPHIQSVSHVYCCYLIFIPGSGSSSVPVPGVFPVIVWFLSCTFPSWLDKSAAESFCLHTFHTSLMPVHSATKLHILTTGSHCMWTIVDLIS